MLRLMVMLSVLVVSRPASAAIDNSGVLDQVADRFLTESTTWGATITGYATWLFWTLVVISMVWTFGMMALRKADIGEFFAEFVRFTIFCGFFWWLLTNGPKFAMDIINSLREIGAAAGGTRTLTPSAPIDIAFDILAKAAKSYSVLNPIDNLAIFFTTLAILACMGVVAANVLLALVTAWVMAYAGIFVLGFGGSRWTSDIAINYFRAVVGLALKLMTMSLLIGVAVSIMDGFYTGLQQGAPIRELLVIFVVSLVLVVLIHSVPNALAALIPGGHAATSGSSFSAGAMAGAAMGAAGVATGAASMAGAAVMGGAQSMAGGAQALMAAASKANENVQNGSDVLAGLWDSGGPGGGGGGGNPYGDDYSTGNTPFAQAAGFARSAGGSSSATDKGSKAAGGESAKQATGGESKQGGSISGRIGSAVRTVADAGVNLARGAADVTKTSMMERVADTTGGRIAASIKGTGKDIPTFAENLLSTETRLDREAEIEAFVRKET